jgi:hypothetical protein
MKMGERLPPLPAATLGGVECVMCIASQKTQVDCGGLRRVLIRQSDKPIAQPRSTIKVCTAGDWDQGIRDRSPVSLVRRLESRHQHTEPRQQFPGALLDDLHARIGDTKIYKCQPDERFNVIQSPPNISGKLAWRANKAEKTQRVHLPESEIDEPRQLFGVILRAGDNQRDTMFRTIGGRVENLVHEGTDEFPGRLVALHEIG